MSIDKRVKNLSSEYGNSTAGSQKSLSKAGYSQRLDSENFSQSNIRSNKDSFQGIQEINEIQEYDEDSVIMELNQLLTKKKKKHERTATERSGKPPLVNLKLRFKEKIIPITTRKISRVASHKVL